MWVRQVAWLNTAPAAPQTDGNLAKHQPDPKTRLKAMQEAGEVPLLPVNPAPYITDWLLDIGPTTVTMGGEAKLAIREIAADLAALGIDAEPWELRLLRRLSGEWADERDEARQADRAPPYAGEKHDIVSRREMVDRKLRGQFAGMTKKEKS